VSARRSAVAVRRPARPGVAVRRPARPGVAVRRPARPGVARLRWRFPLDHEHRPEELLGDLLDAPPDEPPGSLRLDRPVADAVPLQDA
jgi:hypothetical protein